ncbi:hypothetical protein [Enterococcus sp. AZ196]|uniref:hypothetical protein n=1 Tax=Enterococcus sp. AZ196 TaxID=2774659 RepID=UPI003D2D2933
MNEIFVVILLIVLGTAAYVLGWINCKIKMYSILKEAYEERESFDNGSFNSGWMKCIEFFLDNFKF